MKTLVLDKQYQPLRFISYRKLARFIVKDKVEVISVWKDALFIKGQYYPAIVRLKEYIRKKPRVPRFNRRALFRRDNFTCFPKGVRILMSDGSEKDISDIKVNDEVCDAFGNTQKVIATNSRKANNLISIGIRGTFEKLIVTEDHPFLLNDNPEVFTIGKYERSIFGPIKNIQSLSNKKNNKHLLSLRSINYNYNNDDIIVAEHLDQSKIYKISDGLISSINGKHKIPLRLKKSDDLSYLLGLFSAEGSVSGKNGKTVVWTFNIKEYDTLATELKRCLKHVFNLDCVIKKQPWKNTCVVRVCSSVLGDFLLSVCGKYSYGKILPKCLGSYTKSFIRGLFLGDAYIKHSKNKIQLDITSKDLVFGVRTLLWEFGIHPNLYNVSRKSRKPAWQLIFQGKNYSDFCNIILGINTKDRKPVFGSDNYIYNVVTSIDKINDTVRVYNFETSDTHTYIANGICVHNCQYTGKKLPPSKLTVDHVFPKARGGKNSWDNCVTASLEINSFKSDRTPEEAGLKLLSTPKPPASPLVLEYKSLTKQHPDWSMYFTFVD